MKLGTEAFEALRDDPVLEPTALAWLFFEDAGEWRFLVATRDVKKRGAQAAYLRVRGILKRVNLLDWLPLRRVVVTDPDNPFLDAIDSILDVTAPEPALMSIYNCAFNGAQVDGLVIYRLKNQRKAKVGSEKQESPPEKRRADSRKSARIPLPSR